MTEEPAVEAKVAEPVAAVEPQRRTEPVAELVRRPADQAPATRRSDAPGAAPVNARPGAVPSGRGRREQEEEEERARRSGAPVRGKVGARVEVAKPVRKVEDNRRAPAKVVVTDGDDDGVPARGRSLSAMRRRQEKFRRSQMQETREKVLREVVLPETISIQELSQRMSERSVDVIKFLMKEGQMMKAGDIIDADLAELIAVNSAIPSSAFPSPMSKPASSAARTMPPRWCRVRRS